jgi:putative DNA primase/helicase
MGTQSTLEMAEEHPSVEPDSGEKMRMVLYFLEMLYRNIAGYWFILWTKQDKRAYSFPIENRREISAKALSLSEKMDVYFGIGVHSQKPPRGQRGASETVTSIPGFWMDIDVKDSGHKKTGLPSSIDEALDFLKSLSKQPSLIVNSGGGLHTYWLFEEPYRIIDIDHREECHNISKNFQDSIIAEGKKHGWNLDNTSDLARILRLPGTWNWKEDIPRPVEILEPNSNESLSI